MTPEQIEEIERIWAATTPGEWSVLSISYGREEAWLQAPSPDGGMRLLTELYVDKPDEIAIGASKQHVLALLAEVKRQRELIDTLLVSDSQLNRLRVRIDELADANEDAGEYESLAHARELRALLEAP